MNEVIEQLKNDKELRPFFFDFVSKNFILGLTDKFEVSDEDRVKIEVDYYDSLTRLTENVTGKVNHESIMVIIQTVAMFYLSQIGRFQSVE